MSVYIDNLQARRLEISAFLAGTTVLTVGGKPNLLTQDGGHAIDHVKFRLSLLEELRELDKLLMDAASVEDAIIGAGGGEEFMTQISVGW